MIKWQSQLVRINNVTITPQNNPDTGLPLHTFGIYHENFNQLLNIPAGGTMYLRTSGYSNFYYQTVPQRGFRHNRIPLLLWFGNIHPHTMADDAHRL